MNWHWRKQCMVYSTVVVIREVFRYIWKGSGTHFVCVCLYRERERDLSVHKLWSQPKQLLLVALEWEIKSLDCVSALISGWALEAWRLTPSDKITTTIINPASHLIIYTQKIKANRSRWNMPRIKSSRHKHTPLTNWSDPWDHSWSDTSWIPQSNTSNPRGPYDSSDINWSDYTSAHQ